MGTWVRVLWEGDSGEEAAKEGGDESEEGDDGGAVEQSRERQRRRAAALATSEGCWYTARVTAYDAARGSFTLRYIADQEVR